MKPDITIYDIAKALKLAPVTISRALNNHPAVKERTRKRVVEYAREHGYRANSFASSLRKQKTQTIGLLMHEINSYFMTAVLTGIENVLAEAGYDLIIAHSSESSTKEIANAENLFHKRVDGLIVSLAYDTGNMDHFQPYLHKNIPMVFFDRVESSFPATRVIIDNEQAGYDATMHLIDQGCRRITHVTANLKRNVYAMRLAGYERALREKGIAMQEDDVIVVNFNEDDTGIHVARKIMEMQPRPDGVFITNDLCAAICMKTFVQSGIRVPEDIAVTGFNNDLISRVVAPELTTINYPGKAIGMTAAQQLLQLLQGNTTQAGETIVVDSTLIPRGSSIRQTNNNP